MQSCHGIIYQRQFLLFDVMFSKKKHFAVVRQLRGCVCDPDLKEGSVDRSHIICATLSTKKTIVFGRGQSCGVPKQTKMKYKIFWS